jgi:F-type H+-transporting ATPase subunit delta
MSNSILSRRYAKAIFDLSAEKKALDEVEKDLRTVQGVLEESSKLREVVQNPVISRDEQRAAMSFLLKKMQVGDLVQRFVLVLINNGRLNVLGEAVNSYFELLKLHRGEVDAEVISAVALNAKHIKEIEKNLSASLNKKVLVNSKIDQEILGGVVIKIGSRMLDASISGGLEKLEKASKEAIAS